MSVISPSNAALPDKNKNFLLLLLILAGLAGNYFKYPVFLNIDFLFGSICTMLALQFLGRGRGVLAAVTISSYTLILWNHPYAVVIMTAEVAAVGWLTERRRISLVQADVLYWLFCGMPLVFLFYYLVMHASISSVTLTMTKQAMNGVVNALAARLIFMTYAGRSRSQLIPLREIISNISFLFLLVQSLLMLATASKRDFDSLDREIRRSLHEASSEIAGVLGTWVGNRKSTIAYLATLAASRTAQQMQPHLEQAKMSEVGFLRVGLLDREATTTAYFPLLDELGQRNIGKSFADRPFIPVLRRTLQPMLSEVVMGKIGTPRPIVTMLAPVVANGEFAGYITGIMNFGQVQEVLARATEHNHLLYSLIDKNGKVILTNRPGQAPMSPFTRGAGTLKTLDGKISQWLPDLPHNTPTSERWQKSFYVAEARIGDFSEWKLVLEQPVAPFQKALFTSYSEKLALLLAILMGSLLLAEIPSRRCIAALKELADISHRLPEKLAAGEQIRWPDSSVEELHHLISNFRETSGSLSDKFAEILQLNESLELRIEERTRELRESEQQLRLNERQMTMAQRIGQTGSWVYLIGSETFGMSAEGARIFGFTPLAGDFPVSSIGGCIPESARAHQALAELIAGVPECRVEFAINPADGSPARVLYATAMLERDEAGAPSKVVGFLQDITDRKRLEREKVEALDRLQKIASRVPGVLFQYRMGPDGSAAFPFVSEACREVFSLYPEEIRKDPARIFNLLHPEDAEGVRVSIQESARDLTPWCHEYRIQFATGADRWLFTNSIPEREADGSTLWHGFTADVNDIKQAEVEKLAFQLKLQQSQKLESLGVLAGGIAHDFNNILTAIIGNADLALMRLSRESPVVDHLRCIEQAAARAADLAKQMLAYSGKGRFVVESINLNTLLEEMLHMLEVSISKSAVLRLSPFRSLPAVEADATQLRQVVMNLVINASEAIGERSGVIAITTGCMDCDRDYLKNAWMAENLVEGLYVYLEVADSGCGMDALTMGKLFDPFFTTKFTGRGLGMAAVLGIVRGHKGAIKVYSELNKGTTFKILLPASDRPVALFNEDPRLDDWRGFGTVLLVDDEETVRGIGAEMLRSIGFDVVTANDGRHAVTVFAQTPDIIFVVMDLTMPHMDGEQCFRELRQLQPDLKVVMSSGYSEHEVSQKFYGKGLAGFVQKPYTLSSLKKSLRAML